MITVNPVIGLQTKLEIVTLDYATPQPPLHNITQRVNKAEARMLAYRLLLEAEALIDEDY